jgi:hypothetical protein
MRNENIKKYLNFHLTYVCREQLSSAGVLDFGKFFTLNKLTEMSTVHVQY